MGKIGILAYGSLIDDLGYELAPQVSKRVSGVTTPFKVEFARSSKGRGGGPTLVPVDEGGAQVVATILELREEVQLTAAKDMLWRRETNQMGTGRTYKHTDNPGINTVQILEEADLGGMDIVLFTKIGANISPLNPNALADKAISSAKGQAGGDRRDGITYLKCALANGLVTPLSEAYKAKVLEMTNSSDLESAWSVCRSKAE